MEEVKEIITPVIGNKKFEISERTALLLMYFVKCCKASYNIRVDDAWSDANHEFNYDPETEEYRPEIQAELKELETFAEPHFDAWFERHRKEEEESRRKRYGPHH